MSVYSDSKLNLEDPNSNWFKAYSLIPPVSKVLDVGCSSGNFGKELINRKKCIVDGIEIDEEDALSAKKMLRKVYILDIENDVLPSDEKYDIVFMGDVIEHLVDPVAVLKNLKGLLHKNGALVFSMPNMSHMAVRLMFMEGSIKYGHKSLLDKTHLHFYNAEEIARILNLSGFRIEKIDYSAKPLPKDYVEKRLISMGLKSTKKFNNLSKTPNAIAYQYIGLARKSKVKEQKLPFRSPSDISTVDEYAKRVSEEHKNNYKILETKYKALKDAYEKNKKDLEKTKVEKEKLESRFAVRLSNKATRLIRRNGNKN